MELRLENALEIDFDKCKADAENEWDEIDKSLSELDNKKRLTDEENEEYDNLVEEANRNAEIVSCCDELIDLQFQMERILERMSDLTEYLTQDLKATL